MPGRKRQNWFSRPWLNDFVARRIRSSRFLQELVAGIVNETVDPREVLFAVFTSECERELRERARRGRRGPRRAGVERRVEWPGRRTGSSSAVGVDAELRFQRGRGIRRAPRRQGRGGDDRATVLRLVRVGQDRSLAALELELQQLERLLRLFFEPRFQLTRFFIGVGRTVELDDQPRAGILRLQEQAEDTPLRGVFVFFGARRAFRLAHVHLPL